MELKFITALLVALLSVFFYFKILPNIPNKEEGVLYYYQCRDTEARSQLFLNNISLEVSPNATTFVLIPGYTESSFRKWVHAVSEALLKAEEKSCVIFVDHWNYLTISRPFMTSNVQFIAEEIAEMLLLLERATQLQFENLHVIGFSLGGWISGGISNYLPKSKRISRITGIDASFPWKETNNPLEFLDFDDAETVVSIRTSKVGLRLPPTKFDFYVNGGEVQPECRVWWHPDFVQQICSHYKAPFLFINHLTEKPPSFPCCRCPDRESLLQGSCSCNVTNSFGLNTFTNVTGNFYLETQMEAKDNE